MVFTASQDSEPTPDIDQLCLTTVQRWESGELPFKEALALLTEKEAEMGIAEHRANQARINHILGYLQHYRGNLDASIRHYEKAKALFVSVGNVRRQCIMDLNTGENYRLKGDYTRARRLYRAAYETAQQLNDVMAMSMAVTNEGLALLAMGQQKPAQRLLEEGLALSQQWRERLDQLPGLRCEIYHALAQIALADGDSAAAWAHAKNALGMAQQIQEPPSLGLAYRVLGEILTVTEQPLDDALANGITDPDEYFRLSLEAFRKVNMEAEMARTIFAQGVSLAKRGRRTTAAHKFQQVMIMFTQLGMVDDIAKAAEAQLSII